MVGVNLKHGREVSGPRWAELLRHRSESLDAIARVSGRLVSSPHGAMLDSKHQPPGRDLASPRRFWE